VQGTASPSKTSAVPVSRNHLVSTPRREREHGTETGQVVSNDLVAIRANATREQVECSDLTAQQRDDVEGAQSREPNGVCDEDEIVVANGLQFDRRLRGSVINSRTKETPDAGGQIHDLTDANDGSLIVREDSEDTGPKGIYQTMPNPEPEELLSRTPLF
jgi:hypothetical protein